MTPNWRQLSALHKRPSLHRDRPSAKDAAYKTCSRCKERLSTAEHFRRDSKGSGARTASTARSSSPRRGELAIATSCWRVGEPRTD